VYQHRPERSSKRVKAFMKRRPSRMNGVALAAEIASLPEL
jgi:hypothetical protein